MPVEWTPEPSSLTLDELYAKDPLQSFRHNDIIYMGIIRHESIYEETVYFAVAVGAARLTRLLGSTVVTPVPPNPRWPPLARDSSPPPR